MLSPKQKRFSNHARRLPHNIIRIISKSGLCSRKQALELVMAGKVAVNGRVIIDPGFKPCKQDQIFIDKKPLPDMKKRYILLNKPAGYVTTRKDELDRPTVYAFLKDIPDWLFPVGRLDLDSEGLLLFTNDTTLGNMMTDPRFNISRTYHVWIDGQLTNLDIKSIEEGMDIGRGERSGKTRLKILKTDDKDSLVELSLAEGKNREIRRIFERLGKPVERLLRISYGPFTLGSIKPGEWSEIAKIPPEFLQILTPSQSIVNKTQ